MLNVKTYYKWLGKRQFIITVSYDATGKVIGCIGKSCK